MDGTASINEAHKGKTGNVRFYTIEKREKNKV